MPLVVVSNGKGPLERRSALVHLSGIQDLVLRVDACEDLLAEDQRGQLGLEVADVGVEGLRHPCQAHRRERRKVLDESFLANVITERVNVLMQVDI